MSELAGQRGPVRMIDVARLEAERLRPSRELSPADRIAADLATIVAILARELPTFHYRAAGYQKPCIPSLNGGK